jgi:hypothetical protein
MTNPNDPYARDPRYRDPPMTTRDDPYARNADVRSARAWGSGSWIVLVIAVLVIIGLVYAFTGPWTNGTNSTATNPPPSTTGQGTSAPPPPSTTGQGTNTPAPAGGNESSGQNAPAPGNAPAPAAPAQKQ